MRKTIVIGNWKMNGTRHAVEELLGELLPLVSGTQGVSVAVCPPHPYLGQVSAALRESQISLGAQNLSEHGDGAFTGEVSANMLADLGCRYVLVGHSERRTVFAERDDTIALKFKAALEAGLTPVLCVGETLEERRSGVTNAVVNRQLFKVIEQVGIQALAKGVIAYEPVWAIGTGETATPAQAQDVHAHIRHLLAFEDSGVAQRIALLYGGSVRADNAAELFAEPDIDGGLIGGASLSPASFAAICRAI